MPEFEAQGLHARQSVRFRSPSLRVRRVILENLHDRRLLKVLGPAARVAVVHRRGPTREGIGKPSLEVRNDVLHLDRHIIERLDRGANPGSQNNYASTAPHAVERPTLPAISDEVPTRERQAHQLQLVDSKESSIAIHIGYRT
jgi:hypothetical protein